MLVFLKNFCVLLNVLVIGVVLKNRPNKTIQRKGTILFFAEVFPWLLFLFFFIVLTVLNLI